MASVLVAHMCETGVKLPTEGSGIVLFFFVSLKSYTNFKGSGGEAHFDNGEITEQVSKATN